jgi:hypothetical protein
MSRSLHPFRQVMAILGVVLVLVALARLARRGATDLSPRESMALASKTTPDALSSPALELLMPSDESIRQEGELSLALEHFIGICMREGGYAYPESEQRAATAGDAGPSGSASARDGYGLAEATASAEPADAAAASDPLFALNAGKAPDALMLALYGSPENRRRITLPNGASVGYPLSGCSAEARRRLAGGDLRTWVEMTYVPNALTSRLYAQAEGSDAWKEQLRAWSSCVHRRGLSYESPESAIDALHAKYAAPESDAAALRAEEKYVASVDHDCQMETRMAERHITLVRTLAQSLTTNEKILLERLGRFRAKALERARSSIEARPVAPTR